MTWSGRRPGAAVWAAALGVAGLLPARPADPASCHSEISILTDVDPEHAVREARRVAEAMAAADFPLDPEEQRLLDAAARDGDPVRRLTVLQQVIDAIACSACPSARRGKRAPPRAPHAPSCPSDNGDASW